MSDTNITAVRQALLIVVAGIALTVIGSSLATVTGRPVWRVVAVIGGLLQVAGWALYVRRTRGGAS